MDFIQLLEASLPAEKLALVRMAGQIAQGEGVSLYLVGGAVRDLLLGRPVEDIDLVVEGDAETLAYIIAKRLSGQVVSRSQFSTAKVKVEGVSLDMITARSEHYTRPGALPQIAHGTMEEDLARRDFSINAMAFPIHHVASGQILDPFGGQADLDRGLIRVLHNGSFVDDATRTMRAVRYEQRLSFHLETDTEFMLRRDLPMLDTISGDRLRREFQLWLGEEHGMEVLLRAEQLGVMAAIHPSLFGFAQVVQRSLGIDKKRGLDEQVYVGLLAYSLTPADGEQIIGRLRMPPRWSTVVRDTIALRGKLAWLSDSKLSGAQLYEALATSMPEAVQACVLATTHEEARCNLTLFLDKLRHVKPFLSGRDIMELGVPQGPAIGGMLIKLRTARLSGSATSRAEEVSLVKGWLTAQRGIQ
ncbi:CCA tRNA nucleotidyltransferase [SAR202 cluster bacterium AC-647-N09_OGT_505m]|nr:CCA tRNA nucleotidyltransferase [SAR202 cluster bacterium AC-647-N09_OGT_505m]